MRVQVGLLRRSLAAAEAALAEARQSLAEAEVALDAETSVLNWELAGAAEKHEAQVSSCCLQQGAFMIAGAGPAESGLHRQLPVATGLTECCLNFVEGRCQLL